MSESPQYLPPDIADGINFEKWDVERSDFLWKLHRLAERAYTRGYGDGHQRGYKAGFAAGGKAK